MSTFTARYRSSCFDCGYDISPGDEALYNGSGEVVHARCPDSDITNSTPVCTRCFMATAANGTCGCDT